MEKQSTKIARLQRMRHMQDGKDFELVHIVEEISKGGEFATCCNAIPDSTLEANDIYAVGDSFAGSIRLVTCPICKQILNYYKQLR